MTRSRRLVRHLAVVVVIAMLPSGPAPRAQDVVVPPPRFDELVRSDFFAGFRGDTARFERGMRLCERALAQDPLGRGDKARGYLERIVEEMPGTRYQVQARAWLEDGAGSGPLTCLTCHH